MRIFLLTTLACLLSLSMFGQKTSIHLESSVLVVDPSSGLPSLQSVKIEYRFFLNDKEDFSANLNLGYGYFLWDLFDVIEGQCGFFGINLVKGKHHCFETTLGLLAGNDTNATQRALYIGGDSYDGKTGLFFYPIIELGYRYEPKNNKLIFSTGIGTTAIYVGVGTYI